MRRTWRPTWPRSRRSPARTPARWRPRWRRRSTRRRPSASRSSPGVGSCGSCHTLSAAGTTGTVGPNLNTLKAACATPASQQARGATLEKCIETAITDPYKYIPSGYSAGIMPNNFSKTLSPSQIQALVAFLSQASE